MPGERGILGQGMAGWACGTCERGARRGPDAAAGDVGGTDDSPALSSPRLGRTKAAVQAALADDFDTVRAVDAVMDLVHHGNRQLKAAAEVTPGLRLPSRQVAPLPARAPRAPQEQSSPEGGTGAPGVDRSPGYAITSRAPRGLSGSQRRQLGVEATVRPQLAPGPPAPGQALHGGS